MLLDLSNCEEFCQIKGTNGFKGSKIGMKSIWVSLEWAKIQPTHRKSSGSLSSALAAQFRHVQNEGSTWNFGGWFSTRLASPFFGTCSKLMVKEEEKWWDPIAWKRVMGSDWVSQNWVCSYGSQLFWDKMDIF